MRRSSARVAALALLVAFGGLAACGDDDDDSEASAGDAESTEQTEDMEAEEEAAGSEPATEVTQPSAPATEKTKPTVELPAAAPTELVVKDIEVGTGAAAENGKLLTMHYVGIALSNEEQFDASWDRGEPFQFTLGAGEVIQGWDQGLVGMKQGGRRQLEIPPALGYPDGRGEIKPGETLVFVVDLLEVSS